MSERSEFGLRAPSTEKRGGRRDCIAADRVRRRRFACFCQDRSEPRDSAEALFYFALAKT